MNPSKLNNYQRKLIHDNADKNTTVSQLAKLTGANYKHIHNYVKTRSLPYKKRDHVKREVKILLATDYFKPSAHENWIV